MNAPFPRIAYLLFLLSLAPAVHADSAGDWLARMDKASRSFDYEGVFVYQHGETLESMRVLHSVKDGTIRERLISLNGSAREVVRNDKGVGCYFPSSSGWVGRPLATTGLPELIAQRLDDIGRNYNLKLGDNERVADRDAQVIAVVPKDPYRYGYHFSADRATGLLLKASLIDDSGKPVEKFMFTQIHTGVTIKPDDLKPQGGRKGLGRGGDASRTVEVKDGVWMVKSLPAGFALFAHLQHNMAGRSEPVEHFVYSDGLAAVSVFIEKLDQRRRAMQGATKAMGAIHTFVKTVGDHEVMVVGEVPAATVELIGKSVTAKEK